MYTDIVREYMPSFIEITKAAISSLSPVKAQKESGLTRFENISKVVNSSVISPKNYYSSSSNIINENINTQSSFYKNSLIMNSENNSLSGEYTANAGVRNLVEKSEKELKGIKESESTQNRGVYIDMTGMNNYINTENDIDDFILKLTNKLESSLNACGEGVHI